MSNLIYDGDWVITLSNNAYTDLSDSIGAFTGNGKLALHVSMSDISSQKTLVSGNVQFDQIGKYRNNTLNCFSVNNVQFISHYSSNISYDMVHQSLDMYIGEVETKFNCFDSSNGLEVTSRLLPLRQYPYCILQEIEVIPNSNMPILDMYHEIKSTDGILSQEYNNNVIYNENIYEDKGLYILNASGIIQNTGCKACAASCYFFENSNVVNLGYNIYNDKSKAYQKYRLKNIDANTSYKFYILSAIMTSYDFPDPLEEVKRILLNIAFKEPDTNTLISQIKNDSAIMWDDMWKGDIEILPKNIITSSELYRVNKTKMYVRMSLFNIFSCLRHAVNTEINPLNLSYVDSNGNVFFDGDLWLIPSLILLKPQIARVLLEFKYKLIEQALQLSSSFGYKGSKFPYKNDIIGYKNVYWDVISPLHIFNNATICINVWNYYRVTLDKEWLSSKGYIIMKNITEFLTSYIKNSNGVYNVPNTLGLGEIICNDHAFTINVIIHAFKYTIEASYILGLIPNPKWLDIILKLGIPTITTGSDIDVIKYHNTYILDNLITLMPYYSSIYFNDYSQRNNSAILRNINYYSSRLDNRFEMNPLNNLIRAAIHGVLAQTSTSEMNNFYDKLDKVFDENMKGYWGIINLHNMESSGIDIGLNAFLVFIILTCICGLNIRGSTSPSNVKLEAFRIQDALGTYMPSTWAYINIGAIGNEGVFVNVSNQLSYI
jgi:trehalose/maltose hydrolase-like predicted phosphorylase